MAKYFEGYDTTLAKISYGFTDGFSLEFLGNRSCDNPKHSSIKMRYQVSTSYHSYRPKRLLFIRFFMEREFLHIDRVLPQGASIIKLFCT